MTYPELSDKFLVIALGTTPCWHGNIYLLNKMFSVIVPANDEVY